MDAGHRDADLLQELYSTGLLVGLLVDEELAKAGVSQQLFSFLGWVSTLQPVTPGTLAAETGLPPTTIRDYVRRLVQRGVVCRRPNPADGRSYYLVLTPKGEHLPAAAGRPWLRRIRVSPAISTAGGRASRRSAGAPKSGEERARRDGGRAGSTGARQAAGGVMVHS